MHAILTLAASHHRFIHATLYPMQRYELECTYRSHALSGLHDALSSPLNDDNFNPLLTSTILLLFHSWSFVDTINTDGLVLPIDDVLVITMGLRDIVLQGEERQLDSIFGELIRERVQLPKQQSATLPELQILRLPLFSGRPDNTYDRAASSLVSILDGSAHSMVGETRRNLLAWPALCSQEYIAAVQENDEQALVILAHFYAASSGLSRPCDWLFASRSSCMCRSILTRLGDRWESYLTFPKSICKSRKLHLIV